MSNVDYSSAITYGWAFDDVVGCWRAPGENVAPFESETKIVDGISISFGASDVGWIPIHIAAGDQTIDIHATDSDTPFGNLVDCLEQVADGKVARFSADLEGSYLEFFAFEGSMANRVRIVIGKASNSNQPGEREITLDFDIGRKAFVDSVYRALRAYAEGPDYNPYEWAAISIHDDLQRNNPNFPIEKLAELSSSEINDLLWKLYPRYSVSFPNKATDGEQAVTFAKWALTGQKKDPKGMIRTPDPQFEACLSGCNPHPLYVGCAVIRQARVSEWKLMF